MSPKKKTAPGDNSTKLATTAYLEAIDPRIKEIIVEQLRIDPEEITLDSDFINDLGCDSLDTVELVMAFEEAYDILIPDEDVEKIRTVRDAQNYLRKVTAPQGEVGKMDS